MAQYPEPRVRRCLHDVGAIISQQKGRNHATVKLGGRVARWPNPHDFPLDETLLNLLLRELGTSRGEFFKHYR